MSSCPSSRRSGGGKVCACICMKFNPSSRSIFLRSCPCPAGRHRRRFYLRWWPQIVEEARFCCVGRRVAFVMFGERGPAYEGDSQTFRLEKRMLPLPLPPRSSHERQERGRWRAPPCHPALRKANMSDSVKTHISSIRPSPTLTRE